MVTHVSTSKNTLSDLDLHLTTASLQPIMAPPALPGQLKRSMKHSMALEPTIDDIDPEFKAPFSIAESENIDMEHKLFSEP